MNKRKFVCLKKNQHGDIKLVITIKALGVISSFAHLSGIINDDKR